MRAIVNSTGERDERGRETGKRKRDRAGAGERKMKLEQVKVVRCWPDSACNFAWYFYVLQCVRLWCGQPLTTMELCLCLPVFILFPIILPDCHLFLFARAPLRQQVSETVITGGEHIWQLQLETTCLCLQEDRGTHRARHSCLFLRTLGQTRHCESENSTSLSHRGSEPPTAVPSH